MSPDSELGISADLVIPCHGPRNTCRGKSVQVTQVRRLLPAPLTPEDELIYTQVYGWAGDDDIWSGIHAEICAQERRDAELMLASMKDRYVEVVVSAT